MCNLLPAITFLLAWILRIEKVKLNEISSHAKIVGTLVTVGGAMMMSLIRGPAIGLPWTHKSHHKARSTHPNDVEDPIKGALMITISCLTYSSFYILQAITLKSYPAGLSLIAAACMSGALVGTLLTFAVERGNTAIWALGWDAKLLAYVYGRPHTLATQVAKAQNFTDKWLSNLLQRIYSKNSSKDDSQQGF
ncbi:nodulin MtN21 /EamA-like transporter family protein [Perilla frutescens var. hirtella]|nr:nodulin MtN21 /EamA-like transporter family protein [Perilla frutescens var. hirtella]